MAFIPGSGFKKPLNQLETPVYPDIRKGAPRFQWSGKYWKVDEGRTMLENTQQIPHNLIDTILVQNRDYNRQIAYGKSSHRDVVNLEFRPPLQDRDDFIALSRQPRYTVVPRINPQTANDSNTNGFVTQNSSVPELDGFLEERIVSPSWIDSYCAPTPLVSLTDNAIMPDLEIKLEPISASAGFNYNIFQNNDRPYVILDYEQVNPPLEAGGYIPITIEGYNGMSDINLNEKRPHVSASSGIGQTMLTDIHGMVSEIELESINPQVSASSGYNTGISSGLDNKEYSLNNNRPNVSVSSGQTSQYRPMTQTPIEFDLDEKLHAQPRINPESMYKTRNNDISVKTVDKNPNYSYMVESNTLYRQDNERTGQITAQEKKYAQSRYHGYNNNTIVPRTGIDVQPVKLKSENEYARGKW